MVRAAFVLLQVISLSAPTLSEKTSSGGSVTSNLRIHAHHNAGRGNSPTVEPDFGYGLDIASGDHLEQKPKVTPEQKPKVTVHVVKEAVVKEAAISEDAKVIRKHSQEPKEPVDHEGHKTKFSDMKEMIADSRGLDELHHHEFLAFVLIPIALAFTLCLFLGGIIERLEISFLPESAVTILVGAMLGHFMRCNLKGSVTMFMNEELFNHCASTMLTLFLLPMLIFESGWALRVKDFASQFNYILIFAIMGSIISFLTVGLLICGTGALGWHSVTMGRTAFAYASIVAATDPVATLATYSKLKVDPLLNIMVFGDSTFNDAVAIVLFKVLNDNSIMGDKDHRPSYGELFSQISFGIVHIFFGSLLIGVVIAGLFLLALRFAHMRSAPRLEILSLVCIAYIMFGVAELFEMSGIVATIFGSIFLGIYARPHLSLTGSILSNFFLAQVAHVMDTAVFLLTGFCVVQLDTHGMWFAMFVMVFCLIGRAAAILPSAALTNSIKLASAKALSIPIENVHLLSKETLFMMWHAGLRGAISLTLCFQLGEWVDTLDGEHTRHLLQTATFCMICGFLLIFGGSTEFCLRYCNIPMGKKTDPNKLYNEEVVQGSQKLLKAIDEKFLSPVFVGPESVDEMVDERQKELEVEDIMEDIVPAHYA